MIIVPVTEENLPDAGAVHAAAWQQSHREICTPEFVEAHTPQRQTDYLRSQLELGKSLWLLLDPQPVGLVSLWGDLIENLYVLPQQQRRGYGTALLRFAMSRCQIPTLHVLNTNKSAYALYKKEGFIPTGIEKCLSDTLTEIEMYWLPPASRPETGCGK